MRTQNMQRRLEGLYAAGRIESGKSDETGQTGSMIIRKIPEQLRREFKSRCAAEGVSQQDNIIELMAAYLQNKKAKKGE